jgi:alkyl hydroperoxide reductase subunit AhpC
MTTDDGITVTTATSRTAKALRLGKQIHEITAVIEELKLAVATLDVTPETWSVYESETFKDLSAKRETLRSQLISLG